MKDLEVPTIIPQSIGGQVKYLQNLGLDVLHIREVDLILNQIGLFNLIPYFEPFLENNKFRDKTCIKDFVFMYNFEDNLRIKTFRGLIMIERSLKNNLIQVFSNDNCDLDADILDDPNIYLNSESHNIFRKKFIKNKFKNPEKKHTQVSFTKLIKEITFGSITVLYMNLNRDLQSKLSKRIGLDISDIENIDVLFRWFDTLSTIRNICAHHGELINKRDLKLRSHKNMYIEDIEKNNIASILYVMSIILSKLEILTPEVIKWKKEIEELMISLKIKQLSTENFPDILKIIGFDPKNSLWTNNNFSVICNKLY